MKSDGDIRDMVMKIFPGLESRIETLFDREDDFRSLCKDYYCCLRDLYKYKVLSESEKKIVEEYESVRNELEREIFNSLFPE